MKARLLSLLVPLLVVSTAACAAPEEEDADTGASAASSSGPSTLTYLGRLPQPAAGAAKTYPLPAVRPGELAFFDVEYKDATSFYATLSAASKPTAAPPLRLPSSVGGGYLTDIPPAFGPTIKPAALMVYSSEKKAPIPKATWPVGSEVPDADVSKATAALPESAVLVKQMSNADATFGITGIEKTDLGIRVYFVFAKNMVPGSATLRLAAVDAR